MQRYGGRESGDKNERGRAGGNCSCNLLIRTAARILGRAYLLFEKVVGHNVNETKRIIAGVVEWVRVTVRYSSKCMSTICLNE